MRECGVQCRLSDSHNVDNLAIVFILIHHNLACVNVHYDIDCYAIGHADAIDGICPGGDVQWLI